LQKYDVIVAGAGHAGCEAACAAANMGATVLIITLDMEKIAQMSCNPAIGGIAKGQIIREIDALGGQTGIITDRTSIQIRMLNLSKGPAMWSPRAQCDRKKYSEEWRKKLEQTQELDIWQDEVENIIIEKGKVCGVVTRLGINFFSKAVILTNGTFLNGMMYVGSVMKEGGRVSEQANKSLTQQLINLGFEVGRMKTSTPARINGRSVDFSKLVCQEGDKDFRKFSFLPDIENNLKQRDCYIVYTNSLMHRIIESGLADSPLYNGAMQSTGPRYCPNIEEKIVTFAGKESHLLFLEPEGVDTEEYYLNGYSSSLSWDVQWEALRTIEGFEDVKIFRPGYGIEYDYFPPTQLYHSLETKIISNLFFAGQINGTTGYEEAAAQGLMAGINAVLKIRDLAPFVLQRNQAYIGVLIDDLVTKGVDEPYRMFTSRAEYRILLRQDNADMRLTELSYNLGLADKHRFDLLKEKTELQEEIINFITYNNISPDIINNFLQQCSTALIKEPTQILKLLMRPQVSMYGLISQISQLKILINKIPNNRRKEIIEAAEISVKYKGYIEREEQIAKKSERLENIKIPEDFDFHQLLSISTEARIKLTRIKPVTIGQASRIPGVSPSDINILLIHFGR